MSHREDSFEPSATGGPDPGKAARGRAGAWPSGLVRLCLLVMALALALGKGGVLQSIPVEASSKPPVVGPAQSGSGTCEPADPAVTDPLDPTDPCVAVDPTPVAPRRGTSTYAEVIRRTAAMVSDSEAVRLVSKYGLQILNVTWEDTGRFKGSCVGPNISDMTLQVQQQDPRTHRFSLTCLPVIRFPNFSDKTGDIRPEQFYLLVGNENGKPLRRVSLKAVLENLRSYLHVPSSWKGSRTSLLAERDSHVLVSAQACFLPIPRQGKAEFNPVLFNYQSIAGDPAVLTILATREGTSVTVIDNNRDAFAAGRTWGQRLFFNQNGERASLTGERQSDYLAREGSKPSEKPNGPTGVKVTKGLNMVLLIQVPLKQKERPRRATSMPAPTCQSECSKGGAAPRGPSDVENAVVGHGKVEGPFTEIDNLAIERDPRYPIRVTVQFYKATSNGVVSAQDVADIHDQIDKVYKRAEYVGSLVTEGETGRPTEHDGPKVEPKGWWNDFWERYETNTGQSREDAIEMRRRLLREKGDPRREDSIPAW